MVKMDYDDWVERAECVQSNQRPKVKKVRAPKRHGQGYAYKTLRQLDDELRHQILTEYRNNEELKMMLPYHQFTYGIVVEIAPARVWLRF